MKFISIRAHAMLDIVFLGIFGLIPWLLNLSPIRPEGAVFLGLVIVGAFHVILTKYSLGVFKIVPMWLHNKFDIGLGLLLATTPWIFGFAAHAYLPHVVIGLAATALGIFSQSEPHSQPVLQSEKNKSRLHHEHYTSAR